MRLICLIGSLVMGVNAYALAGLGTASLGSWSSLMEASGKDPFTCFFNGCKKELEAVKPDARNFVTKGTSTPRLDAAIAKLRQQRVEEAARIGKIYQCQGDKEIARDIMTTTFKEVAPSAAPASGAFYPDNGPPPVPEQHVDQH